MSNCDDNTRTSGTLLRRTADWRDHAAWREFVARYQPYISAWCREYRLDDDIAGDVSQLFWMELAEKMRSFRYDPGRRFRGWLRRCFHWRAIDVIRERRQHQLALQSLDDTTLEQAQLALFVNPSLAEVEEDDTDERLVLMQLAQEVQAVVRTKVHEQSWQVFWHIAIDGWTTRETADALNMTYLAAYAAHKRVVDRLAREGDLRFAERLRTETGRKRA